MAGKAYEKHLIDGRLMTAPEIAEMLGITLAALYNRRSRLNGTSYQHVVNCYRDNMFGNDRDRSPRYLIEGQWMTQAQIAERLHIQTHTITTWRCQNRRPDGSLPAMEDAIAYYRQYLTGEKKRGVDNGGGRPWKVHLVKGKPWTVLDVSKRYGVHVKSVYGRLFALGHDMGKVLEHYEQRDRHKKQVEAKKMKQAEKDILAILMEGKR